MTESTFTTTLIRQLRLLGVKVYKIHGHGMQQPGIPDLYTVGGPRQAWIELKVADNKCSPAQIQQMKSLKEHGAKAFVCRLIEGTTMCIESEDGVEMGKMETNKDKFALTLLCMWKKVYQ